MRLPRAGTPPILSEHWRRGTEVGKCKVQGPGITGFLELSPFLL